MINNNHQDSSLRLSFEDLWDKGEVVRKFSTDRKRLFDEFTNLLGERATVELQYSKSLQRIHQSIRHLIQVKGDFGGMISRYNADLQSRWSQSANLAENAKKYVVEFFKETSREQEFNTKLLFVESKKIEKDLSGCLETLEKTRLRYLKSKRELDEMQIINQINQMTSHLIQDKKDKLLLKVSQTEREVAELKEVYLESIQYHNSFLKSYYPEQWRILQCFEKQEEERNEHIQEGILKLLMFETSFLKQAEYSVQLLGNDLAQTDWNSEKIRFIELYQSKKPLYTEIKYEQFVSFVDCSMNRIKSITLQDDQVILEKQTENFVKKSIQSRQLIDEPPQNEIKFVSDFQQLKQILSISIRAWNDLQIQDSEFDQLYQRTLEDPIYFGFLAYIFQQFRIHNQFELTNGGYIKMSYLLICALNGCFKFRDSKFSRQFLGLSFTYFTLSEGNSKIEVSNNKSKEIRQNKFNHGSSSETSSTLRSISEQLMNTGISQKLINQCSTDGYIGNEKQKVYLYQRIMFHHIWKSRDFWESAIFDSIFEELKDSQEMKKLESSKESQMREKNICLGQIASILQNMLYLQIDKREIKFLASKYSKLYFISDDHIKLLYATIDSHSYIDHSSFQSFIQQSFSTKSSQNENYLQQNDFSLLSESNQNRIFNTKISIVKETQQEFLYEEQNNRYCFKTDNHNQIIEQKVEEFAGESNKIMKSSQQTNDSKQ